MKYGCDGAVDKVGLFRESMVGANRQDSLAKLSPELSDEGHRPCR